MAATKLIAMHVNKGMTASQCLSARVDYAKDKDKTEDEEYVTSYACNAEIADKEFAEARKEYLQKTGRNYRGDIIAYQIRQSFKPGEITPEEANKIGYETAMRFTKGQHAFICCTHTDKAHIHNHVIYNAVNLDCDRKFRDSWFCGIGLRRLSDMICLEHGLSVIEPYKHRGIRPKYEKSYRADIRESIDKAMAQDPKDFDALLQILMNEGYEIKRGKHTALRDLGRKNYVRFRSLGEKYSEDYLRSVISGDSPNEEKGRERKLDLLIDIQEKLRQGKGKGYELWSKKFNNKAMMKTLLFLDEKGIRSYDKLSELADMSAEKFHESSDSIKELESRVSEIKELRSQIINYSKTRKTYEDYRKCGYSKKFYEAHREEITIHKAAKEAFNKHEGKLPKVKDLNKEYSELMEKKKKGYREYKIAREEHKKLQQAKKNVEMFLQLERDNKKQERKKIHDCPVR